MNWDAIQRLHADVTADFAAAAEAIPASRWMTPRAEGKWSPAEIVEHITLAYETLLRELDGGPGMQVRTKWWQRVLLRFTLVPKLMRGGAFPKGARAPRETRPVVTDPDQGAAIARFKDRVARFGVSATFAMNTRPGARLTHPYFGQSKIPNAVLLSARHVQHHRAQLGP